MSVETEKALLEALQGVFRKHAHAGAAVQAKARGPCDDPFTFPPEWEAARRAIRIATANDNPTILDEKTPRRIYAADPANSGLECKHPGGFPYQGSIPCTGPQVCNMCGTHKEDA